MKSKIIIGVLLYLVIFTIPEGQAQSTGKEARKYWVETMLQIVRPVYVNLSENTLRKNMPVEMYHERQRAGVTHLEALGRSFCGIAPWLNLPDDNTDEGQQRKEFRALVIRAIKNAMDPDSPDYLRFDGPGGQPLVDAAFFAQGLLRSEEGIWLQLDDVTRKRIIENFISSRKIKPGESNWLMFSATIEAALLHFTGECEMGPIEYALKKHKEWYKGDGWYGDGPNFHFDYYNSYVIQPMLMDVLEVLREKNMDPENFYDVQRKRLIRYAEQQEKMISPEGAYPIIGRSVAYRFGAFQALSQVALRKELPLYIAPGQVRCALTAVMKRQLIPGTFDENGWLTLGVCGHQPELADSYVSTGSTYLCAFVFLPLGLPADDLFWSQPSAEWSSQRIWSGKSMRRDGAIK